MSWPDPGAWGVCLLVVVAILAAGLGMAMWVALLCVSCLGAAIALITGAVDLPLLGALPSRVTGLLENDLLQAVPLFVLIGALLDRLPLADIVYRAAWRVFGNGAAAPRRAALALATLLAPMNGSVGASVSLLSRVVTPRLVDAGAAAAERCASVAAASTLGVLIPPSLVLLLLGDALMRAHIEAVHAGQAAARIVNTQDLMHAVLLPALLVVAGLVVVAGRVKRPEATISGGQWTGANEGRDQPPDLESGSPGLRAPALSRAEAALALFTVATVLLLLGGVAAGYFYAIEAAAGGGVLLLVGGLVSRRLSPPALRDVLRQTAQISGSLFALFVAATTFTLLLRVLGTADWVGHRFAALSGGAALGLAIAVLMGCALVLDAFELIFVVVPIVLPPVLVHNADAAWVGALVLLALQLGFVLPPLGYAVLMSSARESPPPATGALALALAPAIAVIVAVFCLTAWQPRIAHFFDAPTAAAAPALDEAEVERRMREMSGSRQQ